MMTGQFPNPKVSYLYSKYNLKKEKNGRKIAHVDLMFVRVQGQSTSILFEQHTATKQTQNNHLFGLGLLEFFYQL